MTAGVTKNSKSPPSELHLDSTKRNLGKGKAQKTPEKGRAGRTQVGMGFDPSAIISGQKKTG